jgi:hypothetical protein
MKKDQAKYLITIVPYKGIFVLVPLFLFIALIFINHNVIVSKSYYTPQSDFNEFLQFAQNTAKYPPGILLLVKTVQSIGIPVNHFIFKSVMLFLWFFTTYFLLRYLNGSGWFAFVTMIAIIVHPYFIWTGLMSNDAAAECFFVTGSFFLVLKLYEHPSEKYLYAVLSCAGLFMLLALTAVIRATNFLILIVLLFVLLIYSRDAAKRIFLILFVAFITYTGFFCFYNFKRTGAFTLTTSFGYNVFIGNNKAYLHGHPKYDIDIFFNKERREALIGHQTKGFSEGQQNSFLLKASIAEIRADMPAFIYRCIVKSFWHWFNIEKIPNFPAPDTYLSHDGTTMYMGDIRVTTSLPYVIYKIMYLPLFIAALYFMIAGKMSLKYSVFIIPYVALWPVVAIMFPDTRFKIVAESMAVIPMMRSLQYFVYLKKRDGSEVC